MSLLRSICCLFGGRCAGEEPKPTTETMRGEAPSDLGQRKLSEKEPAKTNFDAWRGAQPAPQGKVRIRVLNFSSTCRLADFFFEGAERGPPGRTRGISIKRVALYAWPSGLI